MEQNKEQVLLENAVTLCDTLMTMYGHIKASSYKPIGVQALRDNLAKTYPAIENLKLAANQMDSAHLSTAYKALILLVEALELVPYANSRAESIMALVAFDLDTLEGRY